MSISQIYIHIHVQLGCSNFENIRMYILSLRKVLQLLLESTNIQCGLVKDLDTGHFYHEFIKD